MRTDLWIFFRELSLFFHIYETVNSSGYRTVRWTKCHFRFDVTSYFRLLSIFVTIIYLFFALILLSISFSVILSNFESIGLSGHCLDDFENRQFIYGHTACRHYIVNVHLRFYCLALYCMEMFIQMISDLVWFIINARHILHHRSHLLVAAHSEAPYWNIF